MKSILKQYKKSFCLISSKWNLLGKKPNPGLAAFDNEILYDVKTADQIDKKVTTSKLDNGITVVSETSTLPSDITMGICLNVGTRDEDSSTSGTLHSILTTYYKSFTHTNETINYGMVQMSGGRFNMGFNRENLWFKSSCLPHDTVDIFNMMSDCALEPRNFNTANVAKVKLPQSFKIQTSSKSHSDYTDTVFRAAFGNGGLGMPLYGNPKNYNNLDSYILQKFQMEKFSPEQMVVCGLGVENHGEFYELVQNKLSNLVYNSNQLERKPTQFNDNYVKLPTDSSTTQISLCLEAPNLHTQDIIYFYFLSILLGRVEVNHYDPLEQYKGRFYNNIYQKHSFINALEASNYHFTDSGMFMIRAVVNGNNVNQSLDLMSKEVASLEKITQAEFDGAQRNLKISISENLNVSYQRVEEYMKQQLTWDHVKAMDLLNEIDQLNLQGLKKALKKMRAGKLSVVIEGANVHQAYGHEKLKKMF